MPFISTAEAAKTLGITQMGVGHAIRRGSLKATRFGPVYVIKPEDLEQYIRYNARKVSR
jgi:excisionase family DNA binding protein